jgi:hypothetical protein
MIAPFLIENYNEFISKDTQRDPERKIVFEFNGKKIILPKNCYKNCKGGFSSLGLQIGESTLRIANSNASYIIQIGIFVPFFSIAQTSFDVIRHLTNEKMGKGKTAKKVASNLGWLLAAGTVFIPGVNLTGGVR